MAKYISVSEEIVKDMLAEFYRYAMGARMSDGKFRYEKDLSITGRRATLRFMDCAWQKMHALVRESNKEIGWHGTAVRGEEKDTYIIRDIVMFPQTVTGVTVNTDQAEYSKWAENLDDDTFNTLRMQGHSHVNMGVTPSGEDTKLFKEFLGRLPDGDFYIFLIWNKKGDRTIKIFDTKTNICFDTSDVDVEVEEDATGVQQFLDKAFEYVKEYAAPAPTATSNYSSSRSWYEYGTGGISSYQNKSSAPVTPASSSYKKPVKKGREKKKGYKSYGVDY